MPDSNAVSEQLVSVIAYLQQVSNSNELSPVEKYNSVRTAYAILGTAIIPVYREEKARYNTQQNTLSRNITYANSPGL